MTTKAASSKKKATPKKKSILAKPKGPGVKTAAKKKVVPKKKPRGSYAGKVKTSTTRHKRNKNNLTDAEQAFADAILTNREGLNTTDIMMQLNTKIKRSSAKSKAHVWLKDPRINAYMNIMRDRVEEKVEYDLVNWRKDVLDLIDITMGREASEIEVSNVDVKTGKIDVVGRERHKGVDPKNAKALLELMGKQMKLLTDKVELGGPNGQPLDWTVSVVKSDHADKKT